MARRKITIHTDDEDIEFFPENDMSGKDAETIVNIIKELDNMQIENYENYGDIS